MLQIAQEVVRNPEDKTEVTLVFANKSEDDILLKKELDDMVRKHKNFHVSTYAFIQILRFPAGLHCPC